jgi:hypothetical protein
MAMSDPRLNSMHLGLLPRRQEYRRARVGLLAARGWLTLAAERVGGLVPEAEDWPSLLPVRPHQLLPGVRFCLLDQTSGCSYPLKTGLNALGRRPENDIVLEDLAVSRRHCVILLHARSGGELHDTASMNGTFVNGERVRDPVRLVSGDRIRISKYVLVFASVGDCEGDLEGDSHPDTLME